MKNNSIKEILASIILIALLILFLNPFSIWMPNMISMLMVLALIIAFIIFASFIWKENAKDEREALHKMIADRVAFLTGTALLIIGVVVQSFKNKLDLWLVVILGIMILSKIIGLVYSREKL